MQEVPGPNIGVQFPIVEHAPEEIATLSAQHLRGFTRQESSDVEPELVIHDGEIEFVVSHEVGRVELSVLGLKRLGDAAYAHAHLLEQRAARTRPYS